MKTITATIICIALSGCATCQQHPTACAIVAGSAIIATSVAMRHNETTVIPIRDPHIHD